MQTHDFANNAKIITGGTTPTGSAGFSSSLIVDYTAMDMARVVDRAFIYSAVVTGGVNFLVKLQQSQNGTDWEDVPARDLVLVHTTEVPAADLDGVILAASNATTTRMAIVQALSHRRYYRFRHEATGLSTMTGQSFALARMLDSPPA